jgi:hypothetical protein
VLKGIADFIWKQDLPPTLTKTIKKDFVTQDEFRGFVMQVKAKEESKERDAEIKKAITSVATRSHELD